MFKLDLEKAEQPEIKLLTSIVSQKKQEFHKNIYFCFTDCAKTLNCVITANWGKFLKRWEYQITLPASWETCIQVKKQQLELDMEQQTGSKSGKEYIKNVYCHPDYLTYAEYIMRNAGLDEAQTGIKIEGRNINNLRYYADDTTLMAESEELKSSWWKWKKRVKMLA